MALMSFKQEILAVRESLQNIAVDAGDVASATLLSTLGRTLQELESADDELARQAGRFQLLADELRQARAHYRVLFDAMPVPCIVTDIHGMVRTMNLAAIAFMGPQRSVIGTPLLVRVPQAARARAREHLASAGRGGSVSWEGQLAVRDLEEPAEVAFTIAALATSGDEEIVELLWTLRDLGHQRRLEEHNGVLTSRVLHLSASNQELEEFAHVVAHDLKEPLRGMRLTAGFVEEDARGKIDGPSMFRLKTIQTLCGRAMSMVDSVLEAAKIAGAPMRIETVLVSDLVADASQRLIASISEHKARVACDEVACTTKVRCDRAQAARALANLIANGIKYNESVEKRVVVTVAPARYASDGEGAGSEPVKYVQLCVTDNGVGVPVEQTSAIFRMFSRLAPKERGATELLEGVGTDANNVTATSTTATSTTAAAPPRREGTGAGLAIVKKIVEKHGGRVWVEPGPGGGTSFCLTLPSG